VDRIQAVRVDYPTPEQELALLKRKLGDAIPDTLLQQSIAMANDIRYLHSGRTDRLSDRVQASMAPTMETTLSTRSLLRLWNLVILYAGVEKPLFYALDIAVTNQVQRGVRRSDPQDRGGSLRRRCEPMIDFQVYQGPGNRIVALSTQPVGEHWLVKDGTQGSRLRISQWPLTKYPTLDALKSALLSPQYTYRYTGRVDTHGNSASVVTGSVIFWRFGVPRSNRCAVISYGSPTSWPTAG